MKIIKYGTSHCGMCMAMTQNLKAAMIPIPIIEKDCDDEEIAKEAESIGIKNIPTIILLDDNDKEVIRWNGIVSSTIITETIQKHMSKPIEKAKYLYIMDWNRGGIYERELTDEENEMLCEDILTKFGFNTDECEWMLTNKKVKIKIID